jgi:hypothetical protein
MSIQSPYAITLTPPGGGAITLVAAGGWLTALPAFDASQAVFESDGILLGNAFFRPLGNVAVTITFTTEEDHEDLLALLNEFLDADGIGSASVLTLSGLLTMGDIAEFADAVVSVVTPDLPGGTGAATITRVYTVQTSIPTPPPS